MLQSLTDLSRELPVTIPRNMILQRICVRPPYYALEKECYFNEVFSAEGKAELPQGRALGPMRAGDISRHGAIAGSCALALKQNDNEARYYLATKASYKGFRVEAPYGQTTKFEAKVTSQSKRNATVNILISTKSMQLAELEVTYSILKPSLFERLNGQHQTKTEPSDKLLFIKGYPVQWNKTKGVRVIPRLPASVCRGHFDNYPAAPVALLMDQLAELAELSIPQSSYISKGEVEAESLCWAGETVNFEINKLTDAQNQAEFGGAITSNSKEVGSIRLWLSF